MKLKIIFGICIISASFTLVSGAYSSNPKYKVSEIPKILLKDAKAVVRNSEIEFRINDIEKAELTINYAITILNENGIENSVFLQFYDKYSTVRKIRVKLYDQNGEPIKNGANIDVKDYSAISGYSLYEDTRVKYLDPKYRTTPFTVEFTYEIVCNGMLNYPDWKIYQDYNISIQNSEFTVITPPEFKFRYKEQYIKDSCKILKYADRTEYLWKISSLPAIRNEPFSINLSEFTPGVFVAPDDFEIGSSKGNCETWENFGRWIYKLGEGRNILSPEAKERIKLMVSDINNDYDKIRSLYNYLQSKVRYVNIKIGLGGWQTIEASTVDHLSYGDCKALSNYMMSLLDVVGIKSYYTLARAGEDASKIMDKFPSNQFNHAILCVPLGADTIWLECTSQHIPFGYLGTFTDDRMVLITSEKGGALVRTRQYGPNDNIQLRHATVKLNQNGSGETNINTVYKGVLYDKISPVLIMDEADKRKFIQQQLSIPSFNLLKFSYKEDRNIIPSIIEDIKLGLPNYASVLEERIFFNPNILTRFGKVPYMTQDRKSIINIRRSFSEYDTIIFILPANYRIDKLPENLTINSKFGKYSCEVHSDDNNLKYIRSFYLNKGQYLKDDYSSFVDFCERISAADEKRVTLIKNI